MTKLISQALPWILVLVSASSASARGMGADVHVVKDGATIRTLHSGTGVYAADAPRQQLYRFERTKDKQQLVAIDFDAQELWRVDVDLSRTAAPSSVLLPSPDVVVLQTSRLWIGFQRATGAFRYRIERGQAYLRLDGRHVYEYAHYKGGHVTKWDLVTGKTVWKSDLAGEPQDYPIRELVPGQFQLRHTGMWQLFDPERGTKIEDVAYPARTRRVLLADQARFRLVGQPARLDVLDRGGRTRLRSIPDLGQADRILCLPRADRLLVGSAEEVQLLDTQRGRRLCRFAFPVANGSTKLLVCGEVLVAYDTQTLRAYDLETGRARWVLPKLGAGLLRRSLSVGPGGSLVEVVPPAGPEQKSGFGVLHVRAAKDARVRWSWSPSRQDSFRDFFSDVSVEAIDSRRTLVTVRWGVLD